MPIRKNNYHFQMTPFGKISVQAKNLPDAKEYVANIISTTYQVFNVRIEGNDLVYEDASGRENRIPFNQIF